MLASLSYFWRTHLAVLLAAAVSCAVLSGALMVGDSVRGSLRDLTLERLGRIEVAVLGEAFFRQQIAAEMAADPELATAYELAVPAILMQGSAVHAESRARASRVNIQGVAEGFGELFPETGAGLVRAREEGQFFPSLVLNRALAEELGAAVGDEVVLSLERPSEVPRESLLGTTDPSEMLESLRGVVRGIVPDEGPDRGVARFGLLPHQSLPLNAFVPLADLQRSLDQRGRVNAVLVGGGGPAAAAGLEAVVRRHLQIEDVGLELDERPDMLQIGSREILLRPRLAAAIEALAAERGARVHRVSTYLANSTRLPGRAGGRRSSIPYSTIAALDTAPAAPFGELRLESGGAAPALGEGEILLNAWAASELGAAPGDEVEITYYEVGPREELRTRAATFTLRGIVEMQGLGADPTLTPEFPGVHDADDMADWDPTFPVDLSRIEAQDEEYWDRYRAAPKAFVAEAVGRRLWGTRFGELSGLRLAPGAGSSVVELRAEITDGLLARLELPEVGLGIVPLKEQGLRASRGATDLGLYFVGFSFFLIASAAMLVGLFFRLGVERRAAEIGLLLAVGFPVRQVRRRLLGEGVALAAAGCLLGLAGAAGYAAAMMAALRSWWIGAVGSSFLFLHVEPLSLAVGYVASLLVVMVSLWRAVRRLAELPVIGLLRGVTVEERGRRRAERARQVALLAGGLALLLLATSPFVPMSAAAASGIFGTVGVCLLVAGLAGFSHWLGRSPTEVLRGQRPLRLLRMATGNAARNPGRSLLSATLVASACFVIVAVGAHGLRFGDELRRRDSGAGGFALVAESDVPLHHDLGGEDGRFELGFGEAASELVGQAQIVPFRLLPGDDVSCLNLYQPERPRLIGVPPEQIARGGFQFQGLLEPTEHPWTLLDLDLGEDVLPAFGDANSVMWILHTSLGKDLEMENEYGRQVRLRIVGTLRRSIFQSELLISEANLLAHFPSLSGYAYFLIDSPSGRDLEISEALESTLAPYGFDITTTALRLQSFQAVENTYLGTFQTLGGLGLLLGTVGLAVILLRNILERRGELATLRALGFRRSNLAWMVVAENGLLLLAGVVTGSLAALVAIAPHLIQTRALVPWGSLAVTLLLVLVVGTLACMAAVRQALRVPLLPALRAE